jgi:hypothetical protein
MSKVQSGNASCSTLAKCASIGGAKLKIFDKTLESGQACGRNIDALHRVCAHQPKDDCQRTESTTGIQNDFALWVKPAS